MSVTVTPTIVCDGCGTGRNSLFRCAVENLTTATAEFRAYLAQPQLDLRPGFVEAGPGWTSDGTRDWCGACVRTQPTLDLGGAA